MKHTEQTKDLQQKIADLVALPGMSQAKLAGMMGVSTSRLSQWRRDLYDAGNIEYLEKIIHDYLRQNETKLELEGALPSDIGWIPTPTAQEMRDILEFAQTLHMQVIFYGAAGMGKTVTCEHYRDNHPNVWLITPTAITGCKKGVMTLLGQALGIKAGKSLAELQTECVERMRGRDGLIIVDEAQQMPPASMDLLRQVAEGASVGLAYSGNEGVYSQMMNGSSASKFAQIHSRLMRQKHLLLPTYADVETLVHAMGVDDLKVIRYLYDISKSPGALRYVSNTLRLAKMAAASTGMAIDVSLVVDAFEELTGMRINAKGAAA